MAELWPWFAILFLAVFVIGLTLWWFWINQESLREIQRIHSQQLWSMTDQILDIQEQLLKATSIEQDKTPTK